MVHGDQQQESRIGATIAGRNQIDSMFIGVDQLVDLVADQQHIQDHEFVLEK